MKLQKETHIQSLLVSQTIKQIERAKQRLEMQRKELLRLEDECLQEIKADFEKGAFWRIDYAEKDELDFLQEYNFPNAVEGVKVDATIKTESGWLIDYDYYFMDGEILNVNDCFIDLCVNSCVIELEGEEVEINIEPLEVAKLILKHYSHEGC